MKRKLGMIILGALGFSPVGCSNVQFDSLPSQTCQKFIQDFGPDGCTVTPEGFNQYKYSITAGSVDILVVDDNSGSMYPEQAEMANRFPGFLDSLSRLDYRLAIVTTDVTKNAGGFLSFPNGQKQIANSSRVIDAKHADNILQFQNTIKRPETATCDSSGFTNCPSGDERGIFAMNKAIERTDQRSFFRKGSHLAVIVLSDEDERSNGGNISGYPLEELDMPVSFVKRSKQYLSATTTMSVHSIIIRPGDTQCWSIQNSQTGVKGYYGYLYAQLAQPANDLRSEGNIVDGVLGSICSNNYTTELGDIATKINQNVDTIQLVCRPDKDEVSVTFSPTPGQQIYYTIDVDNRLHLTPAAPAGTKVSLSYKCKK